MSRKRVIVIAAIAVAVPILLFSIIKLSSSAAPNLLDRARMAGEYLTRSVDKDGKFAYIYDPTTDYVPPKYNIIRHAGTVYSMMELYGETGDAELLAAGKRAIGYLARNAKDIETADGPGACIVEKGYAKLGGNALAIVALAKYTETTGDRQYLPLMKRLAVWIKAGQDETGRFVIQKQKIPGGKVIPLESVYYPGEAILAMLRLYPLDKDEAWLDVAEKGALYLIQVRDKDLKDSKLPHDHWLLYALNELYRHRRNKVFLNHGIRLARVIVASQNTKPKDRRSRGSYYTPPRSTPTATRSEGLSAETLEGLFVDSAETVELAIAAALDEHGAKATMAVIPEGPYVMVETQE